MWPPSRWMPHLSNGSFGNHLPVLSLAEQNSESALPDGPLLAEPHSSVMGYCVPVSAQDSRMSQGLCRGPVSSPWVLVKCSSPLLDQWKIRLCFERERRILMGPTRL